MDFLKTHLEQIRSQLAQLSFAAKAATALLAVLVVLCLAWIITAAAQPDRVKVFETPLDGEDLVAAERVLRRQGVEVEVTDGLLQVPAGQRERAYAALAYEQILPPTGSSDLTELLTNPSVFRTESEAQRLHEYAERGRLGGIIERYPGVRSAQVVLQKGSPGGIGRRKVAPTASVSLLLDRGAETDSKLRGAVAALICGAVPGLDPAEVYIVDATNGRSFTGADPRGGDDLRLERIALWEQHHLRNVRMALGDIPRLHVGVFVLPDPTESQQTESIDYDEPVTAKIGSATESATGVGNSPAEPGVRANTSVALPADSLAARTNSESSDAGFDARFPVTRVRKTEGPGEARKLTVSIGVPLSHLVKVFQNTPGNDPAAQPTEVDLEGQLARIRDRVKGVLGNPGDQEVRVDWYVDAGESEAAEVVQAGVVTQLAVHGKTVVLGTLAVAALGMVLMFARRKHPESPTLNDGMDAESMPDTLGAAEGVEGALEGYELDEDAIRSERVVDQVGQMVRDRPDNATNLLRRWIEQG
ncbi:MAG: hypothetical protein ACOC95_05655 [Planctomycetota bacterium]